MSANPIAAPFVQGLADGAIRYQSCIDCRAAQTLARYACRACGSARLDWRAATGRGTVFAVTVVTRAPSDEFRALAPYTLVLVDLDEGARLMAHAEPGIAIGDPVVAGFFTHNGRPLVRFRRAPG
jgi:uncharacterized OB-fold protein